MTIMVSWHYSSLISLMLLIMVIYAEDITFPRPLGMWKMDHLNGRYDVTGNNKHLTITSDVVLSTDNPFDYYGSGSFEFTGVQNSHGTMDNSDGSLSVDNSWTYMTWYKNLGSTGFLFVFYPSESSCSHGMLYMHHGSTQFHYNTMQSGAYSYTPSGFLPLNEWTHLAATYNTETGVINMYVNGAEVSSERVSASANLNSATYSGSSYTTVRMGSCPAGDSRYMSGRLFCTQWFDQWLTEEQMNKAKALCVPAKMIYDEWPWPLGAWNLDGYWRGNDMSANYNSMSIRNCKSANGITGKRTKAIKIGYKGDSYLILTNNEKKSNFYGSHTIAMWLNIDPLQRPAYLMDQAADDNSGTSDSTYMRNIWLTDGGSTIRNMYSSSLSITNTDLLKVQTWMWIIIVADFTNNEQRIYIDGDIAATNTGVDFPDSLAVDKDFRFGKRFHGDEDEMFFGRLYCLQLYDFPLSQDNFGLIEDKCNSKSSSPNPDEALLHRWLLDDDTYTDTLHNRTADETLPLYHQHENRRGSRFGNSTTSSSSLGFLTKEEGDFPGWQREVGTVSFWMRIDSESPMLGGHVFVSNVQYSSAQNSFLFYATTNYGRTCNATMSDGRASTCWIITMHPSPDIKIEGTAMLQLPWDELVGRWKHYVVTFDNSVKGISAAYMDGIPIYVIHTMVLPVGELVDGDKLMVDGYAGKVHYNCLQFLDRYTQARDVFSLRDSCYGDNRRDYIMPVGFWPLDARSGDYDISQQVSDWNVTSVDTTLVSGVTGYPDTAYAFNGVSSYLEIPNREGRADLHISGHFSLWVYFENPETTDSQVFFSHMNGEETSLVGRVKENYIYLDMMDHNKELKIVKMNNVISANTWYFVAVHLDGKNGFIEIYYFTSRRNRRVIPKSKLVNGGTYNYTWNIGRGFYDGQMNYFEGRIACVQLYDFKLYSSQRKYAMNLCKAKDPEDTRFRRADGLSTGFSPSSHLVTKSITSRTRLGCMAACVSDEYCVSAAFHRHTMSCEMSDKRIEDSLDVDSDYENTGASDYFEIHKPFNDMI